MVRGRPKRRKWPSRRKAPRDELLAHLRLAQSAATVAVAALRRQNCELDEDIARLLQRCVCDSLGEQLEKLEATRSHTAARMRGRLIPL